MPEFPAVIQLSQLNGTTGFEIRGEADFDQSGHAVSNLGDINGDGFDDCIIGASRADPHGLYSGASYVVFGKAGTFPATLNLSALNGTNGFQISGEGQGDNSGLSVSGAGDINGDGFADIIVGAPGSLVSANVGGASYVIFGKATPFPANLNLSALNGNNGFQISGELAGDNSGFSVSSAGDVNGDGLDDLVIGARGAAPHGSYSGSTYVVFGRESGFGSNFNLSSIDGDNGFQINGEADNDISGRSVSGAGDINGDGFADLIIGAHGSDVNGNNAGSAYVVFGKGSDFDATIELSALNGTTGFKIRGEAEDSFAGYSVSSAGDINGDGFGDIIIGAWRADSRGDRSGSSYVVFGKGSGFAATLNLSALNGTAGFEIKGEKAGDNSGYSVSDAGDVNGDGFGDLIIGAYRADPNGDSSGAAYVLFGKATGFTANFNLSTLNGNNGFEIRGETLDDVAGLAVSGAGDINNDGFDDLLIGAPSSGDTIAGSSYIVYGHRATDAVVRIGTDADQTINGGKGADRVEGRGGKDALVGWEGADTVSGGAGNDTMTGGAGGDRLTGGTGKDIFDYNAIAESKTTAAGRDTITDFNANAADRIDLSTIDSIAGGGNNKFTFMGDDDFTDLGQVRFAEQGANTLVEMNTTGSLAADMSILISGHVTLNAADFVL